MLTCTNKQYNQREFRGPGQVLGLVARNPGTRRAERVMGRLKAKNDAIREAENNVLATETEKKRHEWLAHSDLKICDETVKRNVVAALALREKNMGVLREKLKTLYEQEAGAWRNELEHSVETTEDRYLKLKERAHELMEAKKKDLELKAKELYEKRFIGTASAIREGILKRRDMDIANDWQAQIDMKRQLKKCEQEEQKFFSQLVMRDTEQKGKNETMIAESHKAKAIEYAEFQKAQINDKAAKELERCKEVEADRQQLEELARELQAEGDKKDGARAEYIRKTRQEFEKQLRQKNERLKKEKIDEQAYDDYLMRSLLDDQTRDNAEEYETKKALCAEMQMYRKYVAETKKFEKEVERDIDAKLMEKNQKTLKERDVKRHKEKHARRLMNAEANRVRLEQIRAREQQVLAEIEECKRSAHETTNRMLRQKEEEIEAELARKKQARRYGDSLKAQIQCVEQQRRVQFEENRHLQQAQNEATERYQEYMGAVLRNNLRDTKAHPWRQRFNDGDPTVPSWKGHFTSKNTH